MPPKNVTASKPASSGAMLKIHMPRTKNPIAMRKATTFTRTSRLMKRGGGAAGRQSSARADRAAGAVRDRDDGQSSSGPSQAFATVLCADSSSDGWKMPASTSR